jgi:competence protein ComEA
VLFSPRRADDADVIRARLRALLAEGSARPGWVPDDDPPGLRDARRPGAGSDDALDDALHDGVDPEDDTWSLDAPPDPEPAAAERPEGAGSGRHRAAGPSTRLDPGPVGARSLWLVAVLAAVAVALWSWTSRPEVTAAPDAAPPVSAAPAASTTSPSGADAGGTPADADGAPADVVVVAVVGQVVSPGLVTLPAGSRVADALAAAGGLLPGTDPATVNAAALLVDGQQVAVGVPGAAPGAAAAGGPASGGLVDLNTAALADLDALPGIGPVLAQRILDHRAQQGPFRSVQELDDVSGIGPSLFAEVSPLVTV